MTTPKDERVTAGAGYILTFFSELELLMSNAANYINNMARMKIKYPDMNEKLEISDSDVAMINIIENVKGSIFRVYIKFMALKPKIKEFEKKDKDNEIRKLYETIRDSLVPRTADIETYALKLNELFVEAIDILAAAQGTYHNVIQGGGSHE